MVSWYYLGNETPLHFNRGGPGASMRENREVRRRSMIYIKSNQIRSEGTAFRHL